MPYADPDHREMLAAFEAGDLVRLEALVRQKGPKVPEVILQSCDRGLGKISAGEMGGSDLAFAETLAVIHARGGQGKELLNLVRHYRAAPLENVRRITEKRNLLRKRREMFSKGGFIDALAEARDAVPLFQSLGDRAGEALAYEMIGDGETVIFWLYEAHSHYGKALEIHQGFSNVPMEAKLLMDLGGLESVFGEVDGGWYENAALTFQHAAKGFRAIGDRAGEIDALIGAAQTCLAMNRSGKALPILQDLRMLSENGADAEKRAKILYVSGHVYRALGMNTEALADYGKALEIFKSSGEDDEIVDTLISMSHVLMSLGKYNAADERIQEAITFHRNIAPGRADEQSYPAADSALAKLRFLQRRVGEAIAIQEKLLEMSRGKGMTLDECRALFSLASIKSANGQYRESLSLLEKAVGVCGKGKYRDMEIEATGLMGSVLIQIGQYAEGLNKLDAARDMRKKERGDREDPDDFLGLADAYMAIGRYGEALDYYRSELDRSRADGNLRSEAIVLFAMAQAYANIGRFEEAILHLRQYGEVVDRLGLISGEANIYWECSANTDSLLGKIYWEAGEFDNAAKAISEARDIYGRLRNTGEFTRKSIQLGTLEILLGRYAEAMDSLVAAVRDAEAMGSDEVLWRVYRGIGRVHWKEGRLQDALYSYRRSVEAIERLASGAKGLGEQERSFLISDKIWVYREFIDLLLELQRKDSGGGYDREAFTVSERGKSRVFQEMMARAGARTGLSGDDAFRSAVEKEKALSGEIGTLRQSLAKWYSKPEKERSEEAIGSLKDRLVKVEQALREHGKEMESKYPRYADLKRPKPLTVEELQGLLHPGETVLSYAAGEERSAAFVVTRDRFRMVELGVGRKELVSLVREFRKGFEGVGEYRDLERFRPEASHELYGKVFSPVEKEVGDPKVLYLSGDDVLHTVPFEALVDRAWDKDRFREARREGRSGDGALLGEYATLSYLGDRHTVSYLPSASVLRSLRQYGKAGYGKWGRSLVAFADPVFGEEKERGGVPGKESGVPTRGVSGETALTLEVLTRSTGGGDLPRLSESGEEARAIARAVGGKEEDLYLREQATEENAFLPRLKDTRYVLFSTHGLLGGDFSGVAEPSLALTLTGNPPGRDGFLSMSEVLGMDLTAELVILSACNTSGRGEKAGSGEGFAGLTRSFMYAGGKSLLVTHWEVESASARDLMVSALGKMKGLGKAVALREAKREMRGSVRESGGEKISLSHPFFWAPFVLVGE